MLHSKPESSTSAKQRKANQGPLPDSSGPVVPPKRENNPPPYGAQHRQDALWEVGGNEAAPPRWTEVEGEGDDEPVYRDEAFFMYTSYRPLPGVRLDRPGLLIPRCEWHISPLGRSYFVNHITRTTSWKKPTPERPPGSLMPECIIKCGRSWYDNLACLGTAGNIMSISDGSVHQWTRAGQPVGKPFGSDEGGVNRIAVSPDGLMVVGVCGDDRLRLWNIKEGSLVGHPWEENIGGMKCVDWSPNGAEVVGGLEDGTIRRWNTTTGRQIAPPIKRGNGWVTRIKYSPQGDKFASDCENNICVWSKDGELLVEINAHHGLWVMSILCWSKDGAYIFASLQDHTIRKWQSIDGEELVVFQGHTANIYSLCLSPDGCHLVTASFDYSVRIWDLETNQQVGDPLWHDDRVWSVAMSSSGQYFASYIYGSHAKIYIWSLEDALKLARGIGGDAEFSVKLKGRAVPTRDFSLAPIQQSNNRGLARYGNDFWGDDTGHTPRHSADTSSPRHLRNFFDFLRSSNQSSNVPQPIHLQPRRLNFNFFPVRIFRHTTDVAPCRDEDRYGITPETDAEAAAAMQRTNTNDSKNVNNSTQQIQSVAGVQGSQRQSVQGQSSDFEAGEPLIGCCGFYLVRRRPASN